MLVIEEAKLPPPKPARAAMTSRVEYETPGLIRNDAVTVGMSSRVAAKTVQLRPPKRATARLYGIRSTEPTSVGTAVSRNLPAGSMPYAGPRNNTMTDQIDHTENPMCSDRIEKIRLRRAILAPIDSQKPV